MSEATNTEWPQDDDMVTCDLSFSDVAERCLQSLIQAEAGNRTHDDSGPEADKRLADRAISIARAFAIEMRKYRPRKS